MKYRNRTLEPLIKNSIGKTPVIMLTGARQVGKTTLLKHLTESTGEDINFVTLDNPTFRALANEDPEMFLGSFRAPLVIDEFQYAPNLLNFIKIRVDNARYSALKKEASSVGTLYYLTGSQIFQTMKNVTESLAGRVSIWELYPYSHTEIEDKGSGLFIPDIEMLKNKTPSEHLEVVELFERLTRGFYPENYNSKEPDVDRFYSSYISTYLERDVRDLVNVRNENKFIKFITVLAAQNAEIYNASSMARDVDIDVKTSDEWLSILTSTRIIYLLQSYANNITRRTIERPKVYFSDTGLAAHLAGYTGSSVLQNSSYSGQLFEDYVVMEVVKSFTNHGLDPSKHLYFYRDYEKREVDLLINYNNHLYPVEIKKTSNPKADACKNFSSLDSLKVDLKPGIVLSTMGQILPLGQGHYAVPIEYI